MSSSDARGRAGEVRLHRGHVDLVVVQGMQRRGGGRGHPGGVRTGQRMRDLGLEHVRHEIRHRPHPLADLRVSGQAAGEADIDVVPFVGIEPQRLLEIALARHGRRLHRGVDFIAGAIQKPGIDEHHPLADGANAFGEVDAGAALLVHDADLQGVPRQRQQILDLAEQLDPRRRPRRVRASWV